LPIAGQLDITLTTGRARGCGNEAMGWTVLVVVLAIWPAVALADAQGTSGSGRGR